MSELLKINVNEHAEKKNGLTYLSWAWAWAEVLKIDPGARWHATEYSDERGCARPCMYLPDGSAMVKTEVTIKGETKVCLLPVMDHRNKAIKNPDAFAINTAIMRCMTKAISMHGLGLYIYAGEDLPEGEEPEAADADRPNSLTAQLKASLAKGNLKPMSGAGKGVSDERKAAIDEIALHLIDCHQAQKDMDAVRVWYAADTFADNDERKYCWHLLQAESKLRSMLKANSPHRTPAAA